MIAAALRPAVRRATAPGGRMIGERAPSEEKARFDSGASAYRRGRTYVLISQVTPNLRRVHPPCHVLRHDVSDAELGAATKDVIDASHEVQENPH